MNIYETDYTLRAPRLNNYFYGKLLTVRDFKTEQGYINDMRHMLNRFVAGRGVLRGLVATRNEKGFVVSAGAAIDSLGREIVVPNDEFIPVDFIKNRISEDLQHVKEKVFYLCIRYACEGEEIGHSVVDQASPCENIHEKNYIKEKYEFDVVGKYDIELELSILREFIDTVIYRDKDIEIIQSVPKYVLPGEKFEVRVGIKRLSNKVFDRFGDSLDVSSDVLGDSGSKVGLKKSFDVKSLMKNEIIEHTFTVDTKKASDPSKIVNVIKGKDGLVLAGADSHVSVIDNKSQLERIVGEYFEKKASIMPSPDKPITICLAELGTEKENVAIKRLFPFGQFVYNNPLLYELIEKGYALIDQIRMELDKVEKELGKLKVDVSNLEKDIEEIKHKISGLSESLGGLKYELNVYKEELDKIRERLEKLESELARRKIGVITGEEVIELKDSVSFSRVLHPPFEYDKRERIQKFDIELGLVISKRENHKLMIGNTQLQDGMIITEDVSAFTSNMLMVLPNGEKTVFPALSLSALINPDDGTFQVAAICNKKALASLKGFKVTVRWWAVLADKDVCEDV